MRHNAQERGSWELHAIEGGLRFKLPPDRSTVVGRLAGSDLLLDDLRVSRRHAILSATPEGVRVLDAGSTWGTFVNERPVGEGSVAHAGERLRFGESSFEVRVTEAQAGGRRWFASRVSGKGLAAILGVLIGAAATVFAAFVAREGPGLSGETAQLTLSPATVQVGAIYRATAEGFQPNERVRFSLGATSGGDEQPMADVTSDEGGAAAHSLGMNGTGTYLVLAKGLASGRSASATVTVVPAPPPTLVSTARTSRQDSTSGIRVRVTRVERYSDWLVVIHLEIENKTGDGTHFDLPKFSATDDQDMVYGAHTATEKTNWNANVASGGVNRGSIALNKGVDPNRRSIKIVFSDIFTRDGFRDYVITNVQLPPK